MTATPEEHLRAAIERMSLRRREPRLRMDGLRWVQCRRCPEEMAVPRLQAGAVVCSYCDSVIQFEAEVAP